MKVLGVDPGLDGGLVFLDGNSVYQKSKMPVVELAKKRAYSESAIVNVVRLWAPDIVVIEAQQARPGQGVVAMFSTGLGFGILRGIMAGMGVPFQIVTAQSWQKKAFAGMDKGDTKKLSTIVCGRLWPGVDWRGSEASKVPHDGICDAALIARYGFGGG